MCRPSAGRNAHTLPHATHFATWTKPLWQMSRLPNGCVRLELSAFTFFLVALSQLGWMRRAGVRQTMLLLQHHSFHFPKIVGIIIISSLEFFTFLLFFHRLQFSICGYSFIIGIFQILGILSSLEFFKLWVFFHLMHFKLLALFHLWHFSNYRYSFVIGIFQIAGILSSLEL